MSGTDRYCRSPPLRSSSLPPLPDSIRHFGGQVHDFIHIIYVCNRLRTGTNRTIFLIFLISQTHKALKLVVGHALRAPAVSSAPDGKRRKRLLCLRRSPEPIFLDERVEFCWSTRAIGILHRPWSGPTPSLDPMQNRSEDLSFRSSTKARTHTRVVRNSSRTFHATSNSSSRTKLEWSPLRASKISASYASGM